MTDHPIIFSGPMVRALLAGTKTMTRRLAWLEGRPRKIKGRQMTGFRRASPWQRVRPGDRLWVREAGAWTRATSLINPGRQSVFMAFRADGHESTPLGKWRPSIHMPRWASRLTLTVTAVKVERLWAMSTEDERAEGFDNEGTAFSELWDQVHGKGAYASNPEVVAISFTCEKRNIDEPAREAA